MSRRSSPRTSQIFDPDLILRIKTPGSSDIFCTGNGRGKPRCSWPLDGGTREEVLGTLQRMSLMRPSKATRLLPELARLTLQCDNHRSLTDERVREWTKFLHRAESVISHGSTCSFPDFKDIDNKHLRAALWELEAVKRELQENKDKAKRQAKALRTLAQMHIESQQQLAAQLQRAMTLDRELAASRTERIKLATKLEKQERVYAALKAHHSELQAAFNDTDEIHEQMLQKLRSRSPDSSVQSVAPSPSPAPDANIQSLALSVHRQLEESQAYWQRTEAALKAKLSGLEGMVSESLLDAAKARDREEQLLKDLALAKEQYEIDQEDQRTAQNQLEECQSQLHEHQTQLEERQVQLQECQVELEECQRQLQEHQERLQSSQEETQKLQGNLETAHKRETKLSVDLGKAQSDLEKAQEKLKVMAKQQEDRDDYQKLSEKLRAANALEASRLKQRIGTLEGQLSDTVDFKVRGWVSRFKEKVRNGTQRQYSIKEIRRRTWEARW